MRFIFVFLFLFASPCFAHDDFVEGSTDREHLSGAALGGYLHGHKETVDGIVKTGFWDYDPDIDDAWQKTQENWKASGCITADGLYNHDCFNKYIRDHGLTPTVVVPTPEDPMEKDKPKKPIPKDPTGGTGDGIVPFLDDTGDPTFDKLGKRPRGVFLRASDTLPDIEIVKIDLNRKPFFMAVYVKNATGRFLNIAQWSLALSNCQGAIKWKTGLQKTIGPAILTPHGINAKKRPEYEGANNLFVIGNKKAVDSQGWDYAAHGQPQFRKVLRLGKYGGYTAGDVLALIHPNGRVVSRFPEPGASAGKECLPASPQLIRHITTTWGAIKR